jgi:microcystin-dependent protein
LLVNQASLSRTTYSQLFSVIGTAFGAADSNSFNLPPSGSFIRITAGGSGNDPDRNSRTASALGGNTGDNVGSFQSDSIKAHTHNLKLRRIDPDGGGFVPNGGFAQSFRQNFTGGNQSAGDLLTDRPPNTISHTTETITGNETRPVNVNFNLIVKYTV